MPRILSDGICKEKAEELIACLQMWGIERADAYVITREMKYTLQNMNDAEYKASNPLAGSGMTADQVTDAGLSVAKNFEFNVIEGGKKN